MFNKQQLSVGDWWLYWILMCIPILNVILFFMILLSSRVNRTLKNHILATIIPFILLVVLLFSTGIFATIVDAL